MIPFFTIQRFIHGLVLVVLLSYNSDVVHGWLVVGGSFNSRRASSSSFVGTSPRSTMLIMAKIRPIDTVNLDSIEAFEQELLLKEQQQSNNKRKDNTVRDGTVRNGKEDTDDDDYYDDDDDDDNTNNANTIQRVSVYTIPEHYNLHRLDSVISSLLVTVDNNNNTFGIVESNQNNGTNNSKTYKDAEVQLSSFQTLTMFSTRSQCSQLITQGCISIDGMVMDKKSFKVETGQVLQIDWFQSSAFMEQIQQQQHSWMKPEPIPIDVLYEDEYMLVLNKQPNIVVHPGAGNKNGTIVNAVAYYLQHDSPYGVPDLFRNWSDSTTNNNNHTNQLFFSLQQQQQRPGIVHRLDKGTTGTLIVAKTTQALQQLTYQFANRTVNKIYLAVTVGNPGKGIVIDKPIGRHPLYRQRMRVVPSSHVLLNGKGGGKNAISHIDTIQHNEQLAFVQVRIETGRTHQIRVHLQDCNTPIIGDDVYGSKDWNKRLLTMTRNQRKQTNKNTNNKNERKEEEEEDDAFDMMDESTTAAANDDMMRMINEKTTRPYLHSYQISLNHPIRTDETLTFIAPMPKDMKSFIVQHIHPNGPKTDPSFFL